MSEPEIYETGISDSNPGERKITIEWNECVFEMPPERFMACFEMQAEALWRCMLTSKLMHSGLSQKAAHEEAYQRRKEWRGPSEQEVG
jgi:hypothetical protein